MTGLHTSSDGGERLHALDAVRGGALLLGVALHASMSYLPGPQIWVVRDAADPLLGGLFFTIHLFRMTVFFLIAGFFGRLLVERRGTRGFVTNRLKRVGLPLLVFWLPVMAGIVGAFIWGAAAMNGGTLPVNAPPPPAPTLATFPLTHLWFLYVLLLFYAAALILRALLGAVDRGGRLAATADMAVRLTVTSRLAPAVLALPLFLIAWSKPDWIASFGVPTPDTGFAPNGIALAAFGTAFASGWLLHRQSDLLQVWRRSWAADLGAAIFFTAVCLLLLGGTVPVFAPETNGVRHALLAGSYALAAWCWTTGLIGAALRFMSRQSRAVRYVADASYWVYLAHLPLVMLIQVAIFPLALPALVKFAAVLAIALPILFGSYHLLVRHSWLGAWLNGRRVPWRAAAPALAPAGA